MILAGLTPDGFGLGLNAALGAEHAHGAVQNAQRTLDLYGKINVAGSVDQIDLMTAPFTGRRRRGDGNSALLLLLHPVHRGHALVHLADAMGAARIVEDTFGCRGFSGINVRHDADVANMIQRMSSRHS